MEETYQIIITLVVILVTFFTLLTILLIISLKNEKDEDFEEETRKIVVENRKGERKRNTGKIPRRIIQTYFCRDVPERMFQAISSFKNLNPDFDYFFYNDDEARDFLQTHFEKDKRIVEAFDILIPGAYKADLFRLAELYINGGYYADVFMINLESLTYLEKYDVDCILTRDCDKMPSHYIYNGFMAAKPMMIPATPADARIVAPS